MTERITKQQIISLFAHYCKAFGFRQSTGWAGSGKFPSPGLALDYNATYGGWEIVGYDGKSSGESQPITSRRYSNREFWDAMQFAIRSLEAKVRRLT